MAMTILPITAAIDNLSVKQDSLRDYSGPSANPHRSTEEAQSLADSFEICLKVTSYIAQSFSVRT